MLILWFCKDEYKSLRFVDIYNDIKQYNDTQLIIYEGVAKYNHAHNIGIEALQE